MDTWKHNLPRLDYEEIECLNSCTITKEIESVIEKPLNKSPRPDGFTGEIYNTCKELTPVLLKLFQNFEEEGCFLTPSLRSD